jgi:tRNA(fMet)-specific endonuclease VapC
MPLAGKYLLDTQAVLAALGDERALMGLLDDAAEVLIPAPVAGELFYSVGLSPQPAGSMRVLASLFEQIPVLSTDLQTAELYGELKVELRKMGLRLPENDVWIAAMTRQHQATLITYDPVFGQVPNLDIELLFA